MSHPKAGTILFISHEASRSGAPKVLLNLLGWLKKNTTLKLEILLLNDGPLRPDFEDIGKTFVLNTLARQHTYKARIKNKLLKLTTGDIYKKAAAQLAKRKYSLVYGNTVVSLPWLKIFRQEHQLKTICCIHELGFALSYCFTDTYLSENLPLPDHIIAVSKPVRELLVNTYHLPEEKVSLHYEFIDAGQQPDKINPATRTQLNVTGDEFIIGAGGTPEWRKGTDLLTPLVQSLLKSYPHFKFKIVWLGAGSENPFVKQVLFDLHKCGLENYVEFVSSTPDPLNYIELFDVFVLLSREDPFPLIALEAALLKKPLIAFEQSGGIPEMIIEGAGLLAPYLNIPAMADCIYQLSQEPVTSKSLGGRGHELVSARFNTGAVAPGIYQLINGLMDAV